MNPIISKIDDLLKVFKKNKSFKDFLREDIEFLIKNKEIFAKRVISGWTSKEKHFALPLERILSNGPNYYLNEVRSLQNSIRKTLEKMGFGPDAEPLVKQIEKEWISSFDNFIKIRNPELWKEIAEKYKKFKIVLPKETFQKISNAIDNFTSVQKNYREEFILEFDNYMKTLSSKKPTLKSEEKLVKILKSAVKSENNTFRNVFFTLKQDLSKIKGVDENFIKHFEDSEKFKEVAEKFLKKNSKWYQQILDNSFEWKNIFITNPIQASYRAFWNALYLLNNPFSIFNLLKKGASLKLPDLLKKLAAGYVITKFIIVPAIIASGKTMKDLSSEGKQFLDIATEGKLFPGEKGGVVEGETWVSVYLRNFVNSMPKELKDYLPWFWTNYEKIFKDFSEANRWNAEASLKANTSPQIVKFGEKLEQSLVNNTNLNSEDEFWILFFDPKYENKFKTVNDTTKTYLSKDNKQEKIIYDKNVGWKTKMVDENGDTNFYPLSDTAVVSQIKKFIK